MKRTVFFVVLALAMASVSQAQQTQQQSPPPVNSWVVGADLAPASWVHTSGLSQPFGVIRSMGDKSLVADQKKNMWLTGFVGFKPVHKAGKRFSGFGAEVQYTALDMSGGLDGSTDYSSVGGPSVMIWGRDVNPKILTTSPKLSGPRNYSEAVSGNLKRFDLAVNHTWGVDTGWVSMFAGATVLKLDSTEEISQAQSFLLYAKLPNGQTDPIGILEKYAWQSKASASYQGVGPLFGLEGKVCIIGSLALEGRLGVAILPWGSADLNGQFSSTKDSSRVNVAGGLTATPIEVLLKNFNWAPGAQPYTDSVKESVTAIDLKVGVRYQFQVGHSMLHLGLGVSRSNLSGLPTTPEYAIADPFATGHGQFAPRTTNLSRWAPTIIIRWWP